MQIPRGVRAILSTTFRYFHISFIEAKARYGGSRLGILWIPLSALLFSLVLSLIFRHSDNTTNIEYFLYVYSGYILWLFISESINGSTDIIQGKLEFSLHNNMTLEGLFAKLLVDKILVYLINFGVLSVIIAFIDWQRIGGAYLLILPFLMIISISGFCVSYMINIATIHVPDLKPMVRIGTRFLFFSSPVFWTAAAGGGGDVRDFLVQYNPVSHYLNIQRYIIGGGQGLLVSFIVVMLVTLFLIGGSAVLYLATNAYVRNLK